MTDRSVPSKPADRGDAEPEARADPDRERSRLHDRLTAVPTRPGGTRKSAGAKTSGAKTSGAKTTAGKTTADKTGTKGPARTKIAATPKNATAPKTATAKSTGPAKPGAAAKPSAAAKQAARTEQASPTSSATPALPAEGRVTIARTLNAIGRTLIGSGLIILLFVAYQLWGTNIQEARAQGELESEFGQVLEDLASQDPDLIETLRAAADASSTSQPPTTAVGDTTPTTVPGPPPTIPRRIVELLAPAPGKPIALIRIDKIGVEKVVVEGTTVDALRDGPGHYDETPLPGQTGNASIAGHRTTYGAPFNRLDELVVGDTIVVETVLGSVTYEVDAAPFVVLPTQVDVLDDKGDNRLTLTTCHPKLSAAKRLIVTAKLVGEPLPELPDVTVPRPIETFSTTTTPDFTEAPSIPTVPTTGSDDPTFTTEPGDTPSSDSSPSSAAPSNTSATDDSDPDSSNPTEEATGADLDTEGLSGDRSALAPALGWGLVAFLIGLVAWALGRVWQRHADGKRTRAWLTYVLVAPVFLFFLYLCFERVDRLLPAY